MNSLNIQLNNDSLEDLEEFFNLPGICYDNEYVYFNLYNTMSEARDIYIDERSLLYVYKKYNLGGLKIYCQLAWIDKYQRKTKEIGPFYYKTVNEYLNIPNASYIMKLMRKDGIIKYVAASEYGQLKQLVWVDWDVGEWLS